METVITDTTVLSSDERIDRDRLVHEARALQAGIGRSEADFGRHLRDLNERKLYRENGKSWPVFAEEEFGLCSTSACDYVAMASVCDDLVRAGCEPLTVKSHAHVNATYASLVGRPHQLHLLAVPPNCTHSAL